MAYVELDGGLIIETDNPENWKEGKRLSVKEGKAKHIAYARARLLEMLNPGDTVYTILRHVSKSGMSRRIDLYIMRDNEPRYLSGYAAALRGTKADHGIKIDGCGMDMGFELVYSLGRALWPEGFAVEGRGRNGDTSGHDNDGGYALKQKWL